jgi:pyruvate carboxylase
VVKADRRIFDEGLLKTTQVVRERVALPLLLTGEVRFDERRVTHVSVSAQGVVRKVGVTLGDRVKKGQAVARPPISNGKPALGAVIHASIDGKVTAIESSVVWIEASK